MLNNLYDKAFEFQLLNQHTNSYILIDEPVGFDKINILLERDPVYYGFSYEFLEDQLKLQFDEKAGRNWLRDKYDEYGSDAKVQFIIKFENTSGVWVELVRANINFNDYSIDEDFVSCSIEKVSFENKFRTRMDTAVFLNSAKTLDGANITPLQPTEYTLHSKQLIEQRKNDNGTADEDFIVDRETAPPYMIMGGNKNFSHFVYPSTIDPSIDQILDVGTGLEKYIHVENVTDPLHQHFYDYLPTNYAGMTLCLRKWLEYAAWNSAYTITRPGKYSLRFSVHANGYLEMYTAIAYTAYLIGIKTVFCVAITNGTTIKNEWYFGYNDVTVLSSVNQGGYVIKTGTWQIDVADQLLEWDLVANDKIHIFTIIAPHASSDPMGHAVYGKAVMAKESTDSMQLIYYDSVVEQSKANGYPLLDAFKKNVEIVTGTANAITSTFLSDEGLRYAIFNGYNIRRIFTKPASTTLKMFIESVHALWNLGFLMRENSVVVEKMEYFYADVTAALLTAPFDYSEKTATAVLCNEFEVGYEKFEDEGDQLMDEFNTIRNYLLPIISYKKKLSKKVPFVGSGYALENQRRLQFASDVKSGTYDDSIFIVALNQSTPTIPEKNEPFEICENVIGPETLYNARISPARMLQRWRAYLNSVCGYKATSELIRNTVAKNNGDFLTRLLSSDPYPDNSPPRDITEKMDISVETAKKLSYPVEVTFKHKMSATDYLELKSAMLGEAISGNYGYIWTRDNEYRDVRIWPNQIKYNPIDEEVMITGIKKY